MKKFKIDLLDTKGEIAYTLKGEYLAKEAYETAISLRSNGEAVEIYSIVDGYYIDSPKELFEI